MMESSPQYKERVHENHEVNRQVSIWLDEYDDVFSDFDPRPYSDRALSDDFISELKKVCREKSMNVSEMRLLVPEKNRKQEYEATITKRLHSHFRRIHLILIGNAKRMRLRGIGMIVSGMGLLFLAALIVNQPSAHFGLKLLLIL
jgi:hypothetical protein